MLMQSNSTAVCHLEHMLLCVLLNILSACEHRTMDGELDLAEMVRLQCQSTFRCYEPLEAHRAACPRMLIVCRYEHTHPIPLPTKTPPTVRQQVFSLLYSIEEDLPDLTSRRFLRHSVTRAYLHDRFPTTPSPSLADLHISLANREHVNTYILQVQNRCFPLGTGWKGEPYRNYSLHRNLIKYGRSLLLEVLTGREDASGRLLYPTYVGDSSRGPANTR